MKTPKAIKGIYYHFKHPDKFYELIDVARHTETEEWMVIYKPLYKLEFARLCVRPYDKFFSTVEDPKTGKTIQRFTRVKSKRN